MLMTENAFRKHFDGLRLSEHSQHDLKCPPDVLSMIFSKRFDNISKTIQMNVF